ncbi:glycoside hydrolase family 95-like protein [Streptomyces sp. NPDC051662]|uniref:glycosyl hydrolase family 95 catalytic domain-containing protein n=1 Tax=Streptomyces sp. NPDC051662 TaxID=3154750 RepID=UPI00343ED413
MNAGFDRRTFIRTAAGTGLAAVSVTAWATGASSAWADAGREAAADPYEHAVRDARMEWARLPKDWHAAPYLGNGRLTARLVAAPGGRGVRLLLGGPGIRPDDPSPGQLDLVPLGAPTGLACVLDLWNAELTGRLTTTRGSVVFTALVDRHSPALLLRTTAEGGEQVSFTAPSRAGRGLPLTWVRQGSGTHRLLAASAGEGSGTDEGALRALLTADVDGTIARHRAWWRAFFRRGYVSLPDRTLQRFHWIQLYTLAAVTDASPERLGHAPALLGPSGHLDIGPVATALEQGPHHSHRHVTGALPGVGSKAGRTENPVRASGALALWEAYRYTEDRRVLRDLLRPALCRVVDFYSGFLVEGMDGRLHLPVTHSPGQADVSDCTYDLSLLRWAVTTLISATRRLGVDEPRMAGWQDIAARLTPYHQDDTGVMIGAGVRASRSHPVPSHLLWLLPLREKEWSDQGDRELMRRSFGHWSGMRDAWHGGSYAVAAYLAASLRDAERASEMLRHLTRTGATGDGTLSPNSLYTHGTSPFTAAPFEAGQALLELLVGSGGGAVDVFPAVPEGWRDARVVGLHAPGGYVLDATRHDGHTKAVRVRGGSGRPLTLRHGIEGDTEAWVSRPGDEGPGRRAELGHSAPGTAQFRLGEGETLTLVHRGADLVFEADQVPAAGSGRRWGLPG